MANLDRAAIWNDSRRSWVVPNGLLVSDRFNREVRALLSAVGPVVAGIL
jgi:hypothetical protein